MLLGHGCYYVYILASQSRVLYTGITSDLQRRIYEHKNALIPGFTSEDHVTKLVFFEHHLSSRTAVARERQIKGWRRSKKLELIEQKNAGWIDLAADWFSVRAGKVPRYARDDEYSSQS